MNKRNLLLFLLAFSAFSISRIYLFKSDKTPDLTLLNAEPLPRVKAAETKPVRVIFISVATGHMKATCHVRSGAWNV